MRRSIQHSAGILLVPFVSPDYISQACPVPPNPNLEFWDGGRLIDMEALAVPTGEVYFVDFRQLRAIGARDLGSCFVALVASPYGAILVHIPPLPWGHEQSLAPASASSSSKSKLDPYAGDKNVQEMMDRFKEVYRQALHLFPMPTSSSHVVCAIYQGEVALPDQLAIMEGAFREMGLEPSTHTYNVPGDRSVRFLAKELSSPSVLAMDGCPLSTSRTNQ